MLWKFGLSSITVSFRLGIEWFYFNKFCLKKKDFRLSLLDELFSLSAKARIWHGMKFYIQLLKQNWYLAWTIIDLNSSIPRCERRWALNLVRNDHVEEFDGVLSMKKYNFFWKSEGMKVCLKYETHERSFVRRVIQIEHQVCL